jgi:hypothetical protein
MTQWKNIVQLAKRQIRTIVPVIGTSTDSYINVVELDSRWSEESTIIVANTGGSNELDYRILVYSDFNGIGHETTSNTITINDSDQVILYQHSKIIVQIKSTVLGNHTTFEVDVISR